MRRQRRDGLLFAGTVAACVLGGGLCRNVPAVAKQQKTLWQTASALAQQMPLSKDKVERTLGVSLALKERDEYKSWWTGGGPSLKDDVEVANVSLLLDPQGRFHEHSGVMLELTGRCVTLNEVRANYAKLELTEVPRGRSLQETASFTAHLPWGRMSFGFKEAKRECLAHLVLRGATPAK